MSALRSLSLCLLMLAPLPATAGDPTRPPFAEAAAPLESAAAPLHLSMILREEGRRRAVINGQLVAVTEAVGNARVVAIHEDHVVMARSGRQFDLHLSLAPVKQLSQDGHHE